MSGAEDVTGLLPYSRMSAAPGDTIMGEPTDVFVVDRVHFPELTRECPTITAALVHVMLDRARTFKSSELIDEKMVSLGHMSAHLAHELNNPASAVAWSAKLLSETLLEAEHFTRYWRCQTHTGTVRGHRPCPHRLQHCGAIGADANRARRP